MFQLLECKKLGVRRHVEYAEIMFYSSLNPKTILPKCCCYGRKDKNPQKKP